MSFFKIKNLFISHYCVRVVAKCVFVGSGAFVSMFRILEYHCCEHVCVCVLFHQWNVIPYVFLIQRW